MKGPRIKSLTDIDADLGSPELRWEAAAHLAEHINDASSDVWKLVLKHGSSDDGDLRSAIATCALEHLLEMSFDQYFGLLELEVRKGNRNLLNTLKLCWKFGDSECSSNSDRWDELIIVEDEAEGRR